MRLLVWLLRAAVFFALFAFALNNQHDAVLKWFFGYEWRTRMVFIVLAAFALGSAFGVLAMVPSWWHHRKAVRSQQRGASARQAGATDAAVAVPSSEARDAAVPAVVLADLPLRDGL